MMENSGIWARRPRNIFSASGKLKSSVRYTWAGPIDTQLQSDSLTQLSKCTEQNLALLERLRHHSYSPQTNDFQKMSPHGQSSLSDFGLMFAPRDTFSSLARSSVLAKSAALEDDTLSSMSISVPVNPCYLCLTMDHHNHLQTMQALKKKRPPKPRICYIAPRPRVRPKLTEEPPAVFDSRYKVVVWTGNQPSATTDASIYITIKGDQNILHKTRLCRGSAPNKTFCFCQGARDVFYIKSPALGNLEILTVELEPDGHKRCSWYCDKIEVMCLKTSQYWLFECKNWLSLHHGDYKIVRDLTAMNLEKKMQEFELTVTTGSKKLAGTNANVYVTLYGTKGISPKIKLVAKNAREVFQRKSVDKFRVTFADIGEIRTLRLEHDGTGFASGWFLENVVMKDMKDPKIVYYFHLHGWLARDIGDGRLWREIKAKKTLAKEVTSGKLVKYKVTIHTGDVRYAGTDANVYIIIQGTAGKTKKLFLNDERNNFEKGMREDFKLEAFNTGSVKSICIGHDNTGPGSGWYCEDVTLKKYLCRDEQVTFLNRLKRKLQDRSKSHFSDKPRKLSLTNMRNDKKSEKDDDSEAEIKEESYRDVFDVDGEVLKIPVYEEYYFECKAWLAKDEGDGLIERELEVKKKSVIFKER